MYSLRPEDPNSRPITNKEVAGIGGASLAFIVYGLATADIPAVVVGGTGATYCFIKLLQRLYLNYNPEIVEPVDK